MHCVCGKSIDRTHSVRLYRPRTRGVSYYCSKDCAVKGLCVLAERTYNKSHHIIMECPYCGRGVSKGRICKGCGCEVAVSLAILEVLEERL